MRFFSSSENGGNSLILWLESNSSTSNNSNSTRPPRILMPKSNKSALQATVSSPEDIVTAVDNHYSLSEEDSSSSSQFVGGMGENDEGVWFACNDVDPLLHFSLIQQAISTVKQSRHGVPFGAFTSGVNLPADLFLSDIGLSTVQVSLLASNPTEYAQATGLSSTEAMKAFGQACGFCVTVAEAGFPLQVSVLQPYASSARDLATSLGAIHVDVYSEDE